MATKKRVAIGPGSPEAPAIDVFLPASGSLPAPEILASYAAIDPGYPTFLREVFTQELKRNYTYQIVAVTAGCIFGAVLVGGACYTAAIGHPAIAAAPVGANCVSVLTKLLTKGATRRG